MVTRRGILTGLALLALVACDGGGGGTTDDPSEVTTTPTGASEGANFALVERVTAAWAADPAAVDPAECPFAQWDENSLDDFDETFFRQLDCYESEEQAEELFVIPFRVQMVVYAEFADRAELDRYVSEGNFFPGGYFVDGTRLVIHDHANEQFDLDALYDAIASECDCGEVLERPEH